MPFVTDQRGRRLRLVLACLAVLVLGSGAVAYVVTGDDPPPAASVAPSVGPSGRLAMSAAELNDLWTRYGDGPGFHWTGGDRTVSVDLPGDQTGWLFSDTFLGSVGADNTRPANQPMVHNSLVVQTRRQLTSTLHGGSRRSRCRSCATTGWASAAGSATPSSTATTCGWW